MYCVWGDAAEGFTEENLAHAIFSRGALLVCGPFNSVPFYRGIVAPNSGRHGVDGAIHCVGIR